MCFDLLQQKLLLTLREEREKSFFRLAEDFIPLQGLALIFSGLKVLNRKTWLMYSRTPLIIIAALDKSVSLTVSERVKGYSHSI